MYALSQKRLALFTLPSLLALGWFSVKLRKVDLPQLTLSLQPFFLRATYPDNRKLYIVRKHPHSTPIRKYGHRICK